MVGNHDKCLSDAMSQKIREKIEFLLSKEKAPSTKTPEARPASPLFFLIHIM